MLSVPHLVVIFLVALIVLGPEKLPEVARTLGKMMAQFRRVTGDFRSQIEGEMRDLERQARMREYEEYEKKIGGPITPAPEPVLPPEPPVNEEPAAVETTVSVAPDAPAAPEKSPDGESHSG
jgi:Tat protein translocase TatB subunit